MYLVLSAGSFTFYGEIVSVPFFYFLFLLDPEASLYNGERKNKWKNTMKV